MAGDVKNRMGMTVLHEGGNSPQVDIIAIHGLGGGSESTWAKTSGGRKIVWLQDFLPKIFTNCRIMTYGYNASLMDGSRGTVRTLARGFLENIDGERKKEGEAIRPIIFLAHSLGGLIVKEALVYAKDSGHYQTTHTATYGILFFGTPHRGSSKANLAAVLSKIVSAVSKSNHSPLIEALRENSETLHILNDSFAKQKFQVVSFFEALPTSPFKDLVVDENSAKIGLHEDFEKSLQLNLSHRDLCKFQDENDADFKVVSGNIGRFVRDAIKKSSGKVRGNTSNERAGLLAYTSGNFDGLHPMHESPAISFIPPNFSRGLQQRPAPVLRTFSQPRSSICPPKPAPKNMAQLPKGKATSSHALKAEKTDLESQCHRLGLKLRDIGMKRKQKEAERAKFKSQNAKEVKQHIQDKLNMYGNELSRLENERVRLESKRKKITKRLELIERDLRNSS